MTRRQHLVIPAKAGIQRRRAQDSPNAFLAERKDWIPAFAGMTRCCRRVIVFLYAESSAVPQLFVRGVQFLHTLESGNPEAARARLSDVFPSETEGWIPDSFTHSLRDGILKTRPMGKPVYDPELPRGGRRCEAGPVTLA